MTETLFDFDDILIEPIAVSNINSRSEVNIQNKWGKLPLMTAPMDTVIDENNYNYFLDNNVVPVLPRNQLIRENYINTDMFLSYSIQQFEDTFFSKKIYVENDKKIMALIDVANGHMEKLLEVSRSAKTIYGDDMILMVGNVANPETYEKYCEIGVDLVRIGIGNGNGCLTTVQTGVGYPMASLILKCNQIKKSKNYNTQIVADGGFKKYSDVIKALALGADFIMLGSIFNKALESAGLTTNENNEIVNQFSDEAKYMYDNAILLFKTFRGMSTKDVQKLWGKTELTTSEGIVKQNMVEYTIGGWIENFESYLKSAMSYTGKKELREFIGGVNFNLISNSSFRRFDK